MTYEIVGANNESKSVRKVVVQCNERDFLVVQNHEANVGQVHRVNWTFPSGIHSYHHYLRHDGDAPAVDYNESNIGEDVLLPNDSSSRTLTIARDHRQTAEGSMGMNVNHRTPQMQHHGNSSSGFHMSLYGWRKKCLYTLIFTLMLLIVVNLGFTLWILKVMEFSSEGMGQLKVVAGGLQLSGQALVLDLLRASTIRSRHGQPIAIESSRNFSINTRDSEGFIENQLFLGHDRVECLASGFRVTDTHGGNLFAVDRDEVAIGANSLRIDGEGGAIFRESIQTPLVRADAGRELRLESPTRSLEMRASQEIFIQSRAGSLDATCLNDLKLHSIAGSIRLDSANILMPNLKTAPPPTGQALPSTLSGRQEHQMHNKVYQLCACASGKLFLAAPHSVCAGDESTVCR
ncbi:delta-sarcoglycan isoform X2 [Lutzomyia longipalpis]|nr:delta-sarcoglycan isoform X2 [Lutzomyia longipalpis]XP_055685233.1 delta-sarcoglycan isoform X2 [Lutzomyia longipalpis]